ncbi:MAG: hypothetical protein WDZ28_00595 [Simkaniaceae bacterium]
MKKKRLLLLFLFLIPLLLIEHTNEETENFAKKELKTMRKAGQKMRCFEQILSKTQSNIVKELLANQGTYYTYQHYPEGDVKDHETGALYYYHAHREQEHGHFHTFIKINGKFHHLIGISMDHRAQPLSIFTTNKWVTGGEVIKSKVLVQNLNQFKISHAYPSYLTNQWINAFFTLFKPQIIELLLKRDQIINRVQDDRTIEILEECSIDIGKQMKKIEKELNKN